MEYINLKQFIEEQEEDITIWVYDTEEEDEDEYIIAHGNKNRLLDGVQLDKSELKYKVIHVNKYPDYIIVHVKNK